MGARFWVLGVIGAGIAVGLGSAAGCGSSSSGGVQETDGGDDSSDATPCNQEPGWCCTPSPAHAYGQVSR